MFITQNTNWALSAKGNHWRRLDGKVLVVGQSKASGDYWARQDGEYLKGKFRTKEQAQHAAETETSGSREKQPPVKSVRSVDVL
jgi:hypothetical protein